MAQSGPNSPITCVDDSSVGTLAWLNPSNAEASDNNNATASSILSAVTHYLNVQNFGFNIPASATINGIVVEIERSTNLVNGTVSDSEVKLIKGGVIGGSNKASTDNWPTEDAYKTYGNASDLWGQSWSANDINATNFGVALSAALILSGALTAAVDHIRITVYYTEATTTSTTSTTTTTTTSSSSSTTTTSSSTTSTTSSSTSTTITTTSTSITTTSSSTTTVTTTSTTSTTTTTSSSTSSTTTTTTTTTTSLTTVTADKATLTRSKRTEGIIQTRSKARP